MMVCETLSSLVCQSLIPDPCIGALGFKFADNLRWPQSTQRSNIVVSHVGRRQTTRFLTAVSTSHFRLQLRMRHALKNGNTFTAFQMSICAIKGETSQDLLPPPPMAVDSWDLLPPYISLPPIFPQWHRGLHPTSQLPLQTVGLWNKPAGRQDLRTFSLLWRNIRWNHVTNISAWIQIMFLKSNLWLQDLSQPACDLPQFMMELLPADDQA